MSGKCAGCLSSTSPSIPSEGIITLEPDARDDVVLASSSAARRAGSTALVGEFVLMSDGAGLVICVLDEDGDKVSGTSAGTDPGGLSRRLLCRNNFIHLRVGPGEVGALMTVDMSRKRVERLTHQQPERKRSRVPPGRPGGLDRVGITCVHVISHQSAGQRGSRTCRGHVQSFCPKCVA